MSRFPRPLRDQSIKLAKAMMMINFSPPTGKPTLSPPNAHTLATPSTTSSPTLTSASRATSDASPTHLSQSGAAYGREHETPGIIAQAPELEVWLRSLHSDEFAPTTLWVDHVHKNVSVHPPSAHKKSAQEAVKDSDGHIKYWGCMETHPAHVSLPRGAMEEAMEILTWSYTDTLLNPFKNPKGSPFAPKECQELMDLMKPVKPSAEGTTASALYTRIIAKILHRVAEHRQSAFEEYHDNDAEGSGAGHHHGFKAKMTQTSKPVSSCRYSVSVCPISSSPKNTHLDLRKDTPTPLSIIRVVLMLKVALVVIVQVPTGALTLALEAWWPILPSLLAVLLWLPP